MSSLLVRVSEHPAGPPTPTKGRNQLTVRSTPEWLVVLQLELRDEVPEGRVDEVLPQLGVHRLQVAPEEQGTTSADELGP